MAFDPKTVKPVEWGVIGAGAVSFIALFLPWYGVSYLGFSASVSGFSTGYGWLAGLLVVAGAVWFFLHRAEVGLPNLPASPLVVTIAASGLGFLLILLRWVTLPRGSFGIGHQVSYGGRFGIWIAILAAAVELGSAVVLFRQSGEAVPWKRTGTASSTPPAA